MLAWQLLDGLIVQLSYNGSDNFILPWGIETADSWSFFSLDKSVGYRYQLLDSQITLTDKEIKQSAKVAFSEGQWQLTVDEQLGEKEITRFAEISTEQKSVFMDFVQRYRFKKDFFDYAQIKDKKIFHTNSNVYHQEEVKEVFLYGKKFGVRISITDYETCDKFTPTMYVRDRGDEWIVHVRMIPKKPDFEVIKLCSKYFKTSPLPKWLTRIVLSSDNLKNYLWYRSERHPYKTKIMNFFSPNAFPMIQLEKHKKIWWKSKMEIV